MTPVEYLTSRLLDGEITDAQYQELCRLLVEDENARQIHFALCRQEGLLRTENADLDVTRSTMARLRDLEAHSTGPPPLPPPVVRTAPVPVPVVVADGRSRRDGISRTRRSRPLLWIASAALLLLVAGLLAVFLDVPVSFQERQLARALPPEPARMASVGPRVRIERDGQLLDVTGNFDLRPDDRIRVPDESWATLAYQDATRVLLHPNTEADFQPPARDPSDAASKRLLLRHGALAAQVAEQSPGRAVELATANATARVLGTRLLLSTEPDQTHLDVLQGRVRLTRGSDGASIEASAGFCATVEPGARLVTRRTANRLTRDLVSLYLFDEGKGPVVHDRAGGTDPLDLQIADPDATHWISGGGLALRRPTVLASRVPAAPIVRACRQTSELTIEAWIKPTTMGQVGPARIVSLSVDPYHRNFTLAHETAPSGAADDRAMLLTRLRTTGADANGFPELRTVPGVVQADEMHVVYTRLTSGESRIYIDGVQRSRMDTTGDFSGWDDRFQLYLGNEGTMDRPWLGEYHLVAVYSRALTHREILRNFTACIHMD